VEILEKIKKAAGQDSTWLESITSMNTAEKLEKHLAEKKVKLEFTEIQWLLNEIRDYSQYKIDVKECLMDNEKLSDAELDLVTGGWGSSYYPVEGCPNGFTRLNSGLFFAHYKAECYVCENYISFEQDPQLLRRCTKMGYRTV
jgi:molybdopterin converting factor small subunit